MLLAQLKKLYIGELDAADRGASRSSGGGGGGGGGTPMAMIIALVALLVGAFVMMGGN